MPSTAKDLHVLICEKEYLVALDIETQLEREGATVAATFSSYADLLTALERDDLHYNAAVLTVELDHEAFARVVAIIAASGASIVLASGYPQSEIPPDLHQFAFFSKPVNLHGLTVSLCDGRTLPSDQKID